MSGSGDGGGGAAALNTDHIMGFGGGDMGFGTEGLGLGKDEVGKEKVIIRVQKYRGRKWLTLLFNLAEDLDKKKIMKALKKSFKCNGAVKTDKEMGEYIQLQGDHGAAAKEFLVENEICRSDEIAYSGVSKN